MRKPNLVWMIAGGCAAFILILDSQTAIQGMGAGLDICLRTLIPSLFPFLFLSGLLVSGLSEAPSRIFRPLAKLCTIPEQWAAVVTIGWLGGYPVGAKSVAQRYKSGILSNMDATRLAILCNTCGPAFIFGVIGSFFADKATVATLWGIHLIGAILTGYLYPVSNISSQSVPATHPTFSELMKNAVSSMASVCGCVVLFRMILEFMNRWIFWLLPSEVIVAVTGMLELANGCLLLEQIENQSIRFILASGMISFGGLCIFLQTESVFPDINPKVYIMGKILQSGFSLVLACLYVAVSHRPTFVCLFLAAIMIGIIVVGRTGTQNSSSNLVSFDV